MSIISESTNNCEGQALNAKISILNLQLFTDSNIPSLHWLEFKTIFG